MDSETILCSKGCGFFGTAATLNMCSKCYRDHCRKEHQPATVEASLGRLNIAEETPKCVEKNVVESVEVAGSKKGSNRCGCCNKKVGILGFKCKCGVTFCGAHRYPEEHKCNFDRKSVGRDVLARDNPLVVADKVLRF